MRKTFNGTLRDKRYAGNRWEGQQEGYHHKDKIPGAVIAVRSS